MDEVVRPRYVSVVHDSARWDGFVFRPGDIVISTPPKCGTTWMQTICALLIFQSPEFGLPLAEISPWLDMLTSDRDSIVAMLEAQSHRRFVKTHTPLDGLPMQDDVTYVCVGRDPRDVAISMDNHMDNMNLLALLSARASAVGLEDIADKLASGPPPRADDPLERFWQWVDDPSPPTETPSSLISALHHMATFLQESHRPNVALFHYSDLKADLDGEMRRVAAALGIEIAESRWPALVEAATFERMSERADVLAPNTNHVLWQDNKRFFNRGTSGQWRALLDDDGLRRYEARVAELASPAVAAWAHGRDREVSVRIVTP